MSVNERSIYDEQAELAVLGCLVNEDAIRKEHLSSLSRADFFVQAHQRLFDKISELHGRAEPVTLDRLSPEENAGLLADAMLQAVVPNFSSYLAILKRESLRRKAVADAQETIRVAMEEPEKFMSGAKSEDFGRLDKGRFDVNHPPEKPVPVISLCGQGLSTSGNVTVIAAQLKAAKTSTIMAGLASMMTPKGDCLGFTGTWTGGAWVHLDSEQSSFDFDKAIRTSLRRAGMDVPPDWLRSYSTVHLDIDERRELFFAELERASKEHGRLSGASIDGVADLCHDPNDSAEAFALVSRLNRAAAQYDCPIIVSLHENPGSENGKTRGHLGSELARKAETNLSLAKDADGIVTMFTERSRSIHIPKANGPRFAWDESAGMHLSCASIKGEKENAKAHEIDGVLAQVFEAAPLLSYTDLRGAIMRIRGITQRAAEKYIACLQPKFIKQTASGLYGVKS